MRYRILFSLSTVVLAFEVAAQSAVDVVRPEEQQKARRAVVKQQEKRAKRASIIEFRGEQAFSDKDLRIGLKEEITTIEDFGLSPARADDLAFFLEVFYRKHGYAKVDVHYVIESGDRLRLNINEGPRFMLSQVIFTETRMSRRTNSSNTWSARHASDIHAWKKGYPLWLRIWRMARIWYSGSMSPKVF